MDEPSGPDLAAGLRERFPDMDVTRFDDDVALFSGDDGDVRPCGVLSAFSWTFDRWVAVGALEPIRRALDLVEDWLVRYAPPNREAPGSGMYDAVLTCFLENVLPTTPEGHPFVVPNLGPTTRAICAASDPASLLPHPDARLAT